MDNKSLAVGAHLECSLYSPSAHTHTPLQLALQPGMTECDRESGDKGLGESRNNNTAGPDEIKPGLNQSPHPPANTKLYEIYMFNCCV